MPYPDFLNMKKSLIRKTIKVLFNLRRKYFFVIVFKKLRWSTFISKKNIKDILIINGCYIEHPSRYRVDHQLEQLELNNISCDKIWYKDLKKEHIKRYRGFVFFRCIYTPFIGDFIELGKHFNKTFFYDIDDLVFSEKEVSKIEFVQNLRGKKKENYYFGIRNNLKLMKLCDYGITSTDVLGSEMNRHIKEVFINRNVASEEMLSIFNEKENNRKDINNFDDHIKIAYSSGSITHDPDLEMISGALKRILEENNVTLVLYGRINLPVKLKKLKDKIEIKPFAEWRKFYEDFNKIDINLAPLEDTLLNRAKSENKWTEASLAKKVTIASDVGAFKLIIKNNKNGILVKNSEKDWYKKLKDIIHDKMKREVIAENAYIDAIKYHTTINTGKEFALWIVEKLKPSIGFVLPDIKISGGMLVVVRHACFLREAGYDVYIISCDNDESQINTKYGNLNVTSYSQYLYAIYFDKLIATLYTTVSFVHQYGKAYEKYYLVQNYEVDFYLYRDMRRFQASITYNIRNSIKYITISKWCKKWLSSKYRKLADYAPNGIDLELFKYKKRNWENSKFVILIEGNCNDAYKNVDESFRIIELLDREKYKIIYLSYKGNVKKWYRSDEVYFNIPFEKVSKIYHKSHILLKSSIVESFSYPPLEMMATGGIAVVAKNGGNKEYIKHKYNALTYCAGNIQQAAKYIEDITSHKELRDEIISGGLETAKNRSWDKFKDQIIELYN